MEQVCGLCVVIMEQVCGLCVVIMEQVCGLCVVIMEQVCEFFLCALRKTKISVTIIMCRHVHCTADGVHPSLGVLCFLH